MYDKAFDTCLFVFAFVPDWYKTQEMCTVLSVETFMSKYCFDRYKTQLMWNKIVDNFQSTSKLISD